MLKRRLILCVLGMPLLTSVAAAEIIMMPTVSWHLSFGDVRNGFVYRNLSTHAQYVQVGVESGKSRVFINNDSAISCRATLNAEQNNYSRVCLLPQGAQLNVYLGANAYDATGFYQVALAE